MVIEVVGLRFFRLLSLNFFFSSFDLDTIEFGLNRMQNSGLKHYYLTNPLRNLVTRCPHR